MSNEIVTYTPESLNNEYQTIMSKSSDFSRQIASGKDMADLGPAQQELIAIAQEITSTVTVEKQSFLGKLFTSAKEKAEAEVMKRQTVQEVTDRVFGTLQARQSKLVKAVQVLEKVESSLQEESLALNSIESKSLILLEAPEIAASTEMACKSVASQCGLAVMQNQKNRQTVDVVIKTAMQLSSDIANQLPKLQSALNSELTMSQTLNELREFKEAYDTTVTAIDAISDTNDTQMFEMLDAVLDVQSRDQHQIERMNRQAELNKTRTAALQEKVRNSRAAEDIKFQKVQEMRQQQHFTLIGEVK